MAPHASQGAVFACCWVVRFRGAPSLLWGTRQGGSGKARLGEGHGRQRSGGCAPSLSCGHPVLQGGALTPLDPQAPDQAPWGRRERFLLAFPMGLQRGWARGWLRAPRRGSEEGGRCPPGSLWASVFRLAAWFAHVVFRGGFLPGGSGLPSTPPACG